MHTKIKDLEWFSNFRNSCNNYNSPFKSNILFNDYDKIDSYAKGSKIKIKKANKGKFTDYCGGKVTSECIKRGKKSSSSKIRKRATFAENARKWKHS